MPFFKMQNKLTFQLPDAVPIQPINDSLFTQKNISLSIEFDIEISEKVPYLPSN